MQRQLQHYLYSSNHLVKLLIQILTLIIQLLFSEKQLFLMHGKMVEFISFARDEVAFTCRQIKQLRRFIYYEPIHLNLVTAYELPLFGYFSNSVKINC